MLDVPMRGYADPAPGGDPAGTRLEFTGGAVAEWPVAGGDWTEVQATGQLR